MDVITITHIIQDDRLFFLRGTLAYKHEGTGEDPNSTLWLNKLKCVNPLENCHLTNQKQSVSQRKLGNGLAVKFVFPLVTCIISLLNKLIWANEME